MRILFHAFSILTIYAAKVEIITNIMLIKQFTKKLGHPVNPMVQGIKIP